MSRSVAIEFLGKDKSLGKTMGDVDGKSHKLIGTLAKVGKTAALGLAAGAAAGAVGLFKLTQGAVEDEAAQKRLALQLKNSAGATDRQVGSVENWITAQGKALGVTDDELRPALARLVTATKDVGDAQKLTSLAMDVSAGSGKSLEQVSTALMKAQNGQVSSLSRLGINTKDAAGQTITMEEAVRRMGETFGGAAAAQAGTLDGKMARLKLILAETGETIGAKLIPVVTTMADWFLTKGLPALQAFGGWIQTNVLPVLQQLGDAFTTRVIPAAQQLATWLGTNLIPALQQIGAWITGTVLPALSSFTGMLNQNHDVVVAVAAGLVVAKAGLVAYAAYQKIAAAATVAWTTVQKVLNGTLRANPIGIVITALALLAGGMVIAYNRSETFRGIVDRVADVLRGTVLPIIGRVVGAVGGTLVGAVQAGISILGSIIGKMVAVGGAFVDGVQDVARFVNGVREKIGNALEYIGGIPGRVTSAVGDLGGVLLGAGQALIQGLIDGVTNKLGALKDKLSSVTKLIPDWKGPLDKDKILLTPAGEALMEGLIKGIEKKKSKLQTVLEKITGEVKKRQDALAELLDKRQSIVDSFRGFVGSVFGDTGEEGGPTAQGIVNNSANQAFRAGQLNNDVATLISKGLSQALIQDMIDQGQSGIDQIHALAGATDEQIRAVNANQAATAQALADAGLKAANAVVGGAILQAQNDLALADGIRDKLRELLEQQDKNTIIQIKLGGRTLHATLLQLKREMNRKLELD